MDARELELFEFAADVVGAVLFFAGGGGDFGEVDPLVDQRVLAGVDVAEGGLEVGVVEERGRELGGVFGLWRRVSGGEKQQQQRKSRHWGE